MNVQTFSNFKAMQTCCVLLSSIQGVVAFILQFRTKSQGVSLNSRQMWKFNFISNKGNFL